MAYNRDRMPRLPRRMVIGTILRGLAMIPLIGGVLTYAVWSSHAALALHDPKAWILAATGLVGAALGAAPRRPKRMSLADLAAQGRIAQWSGEKMSRQDQNLLRQLLGSDNFDPPGRTLELHDNLISLLPDLKDDIARSVIEKFRQKSDSVPAERIARLVTAGLASRPDVREKIRTWILDDFISVRKMQNPAFSFWTESQLMEALPYAPPDILLAVFARLNAGPATGMGMGLDSLREVTSRLAYPGTEEPFMMMFKAHLGQNWVPVFAVARYLKKLLRQRASREEINRELNWVMQTALPRLDPLMPGWRAAFPDPEDWLWLAALVVDHPVNTGDQTKEFMDDALWAAQYSAGVRNRIHLSFGPHLRTNFKWDIDKSDLLVFVNQLSSFQRDLQWSSTTDPDDPDLRQRDLALRSTLHFQKLPELESLLKDGFRESLRLIIDDLIRRRTPRWLFEPSRAELIYFSLFMEQDAARLAAFNTRHPADQASLVQVYTGDPRSKRYRETMVTLRPSRLSDTMNWLKNLMIGGTLALMAWTGSNPHAVPAGAQLTRSAA